MSHLTAGISAVADVKTCPAEFIQPHRHLRMSFVAIWCDHTPTPQPNVISFLPPGLWYASGCPRRRGPPYIRTRVTSCAQGWIPAQGWIQFALDTLSKCIHCPSAETWKYSYRSRHIVISFVNSVRLFFFCKMQNKVLQYEITEKSRVLEINIILNNNKNNICCIIAF